MDTIVHDARPVVKGGRDTANNLKLRWAIKLAEMGFLILRLRSNSKRPIGGFGWSRDATSDAETIRTWFEESPDINYGVCPGPGHVIIDIDVGPGKDGETRLSELTFEPENGDVPVTFIVRSPSGGRHLYFSTPAEVGNANKFPDGIDVRGSHGYVVGPGCTFGGKEYVVENADAEIADVPDWIRTRYLKPKGQRVENADVPMVPLDLPESIERAESYLDDAPADNGNDAAYHVACWIRDFGVSEAKAVELIGESDWNKRLRTKEGKPWPWEPDELSDVVANAYRYAQNRLGAKADMLALFESMLTPEELAKFELQDGADSTDSVSEDRPLSAAELAVGNFPRAEHLWHDFILKDHPNSLDGDGGIGKTQLLIQVAVAVAAGQPLFGHDTIQMPVLLVLCEDTYGETKWRLMKACEDFGVELEDLPLEVWCRPGEDSTLAVVNDVGEWKCGPFYEPLTERLKAFGPCFLGLDTVSDVAVLDENKRLPVNTFAKRVLGGLCSEYGATVLVTRHPSKASMTDESFYAGSTAGNAAYRNRLAMKAVKKGNKRSVEVVKSNYGLKGSLDLYFLNDVLSSWGGMDEKRQQTEERESVFAVLSKLREDGIAVVPSHGNGHKPKDLVPILKEEHGLDMEPKEVRDHLKALQVSKHIHWVPSKPGKNARAATFEIGPLPDGER